MGKIQDSKSTIISVIVPTYKQEAIIEENLLQIKNVMDQMRYDYEIIVVVDGFVDKTYERAKKLKFSKIIVVGYKHNHGKGNAVRYGMAKAKGNIIAFIDSGMDINSNGLSMLLEHFEWYNADIVVGSKLHPVSKVNYPLQRKILSFGYRALVKILFGLHIRDTQVGLKFFRRKVLEDVLPRLLVKQYAFDIEILAVAYYLGYKRIFEAPVELDFKEKSSIAPVVSVSFWKTILHMLWDTLAVFYRLKIIHYYNNKGKRKRKLDPELDFKVNIT
ncbi:MAG: glycosyltransferase [Candidatus Levyibacteriota bacterium]|nr:MAG: glycosyltransferase [Candidatus Levybacteria bacterium]